MENEKLSNNQGESFPPLPGRYSLFSPPRNNFNVKSEPFSSTPPPLGPGPISETGRFSHDVSRMPETPPKNMGHRRAHSEILTLPDDLSFDSDLGVVGGFDGPCFSDDTEEDLLAMYLDMDKFNASSASSNFQMGEPSSGVAGAQASSGATPQGENAYFGGANDRPVRARHQHSQSMDGWTTIKPEMLMSGGEDSISADAKKAMSAAKLAELALIDPKRAKRIWANRQSAARSKERKIRYIAELERKVQTLQTEATSLSAQLTLLQRDTNGLTVENNELKLRFQSMEQQVHSQDALNDALKEEIQHLKALTSQIANGGPMMMMNYPSPYQQYYPNNNNQAMHNHLLATQQFQQLHVHSQKQQQQHHHPQHQQFQHQLQQHSGEMKVRISMPSPSRKESSPDTNNPPSAAASKDLQES